MGTIAILGAGRLAQALGRLLRDRGHPVAALASRNPQHAKSAAAFVGAEPVPLNQLRANRLLIAVSDDALEEVAAALDPAPAVALHTCGSQGPEALDALARRGTDCGVLHPLQTIATPEQGLQALPGSSFALTGAPEAAAWAREIVAALGGTPLEIAPGRLPLYHAAAVLASNAVIGLLDAAVILLVSAGLDESAALRALAPLVSSSAANALALSPEAALTGPIQRGDLETVRRHLRALETAPETAAGLYRAAGRHLLTLARRRGLSPERARQIEDLLEGGGHG